MHRRVFLSGASITLFFFGGVARITREPDTAGQEFQIAFAGLCPATFASRRILSASGVATPQPHAPTCWQSPGSLDYVNFILATFNLLLPGFPLDGGRILRSIVWGITKDYSALHANRGARRQVVAYAMMGGA